MRIVVGIDGSNGSYRALQVAVREAATAGAALEVVQAWDVPFDPGSTHILADDVEREAQRSAARLIHDARAEISPEVPDVVVRTERGLAAEVLRRAGKDADQVIVGSSGRGAIDRLLHGSVATSLLKDAPCPVLVVPSPPGGKQPHTSPAATNRLIRELMSPQALSDNRTDAQLAPRL